MLELIQNNPFLTMCVIIVTQIVFLTARTLNVMYTAEKNYLATIITGNIISIFWLITITIGVNSLISGSPLPILGYLIGGTIGTLLGFKFDKLIKGRAKRKLKKV